MPVEPQPSLEPVATSTHCLCPRQRHNIHEVDCMHEAPIHKKPNPRAGKRAWREYRKALNA